MTEPSTIEPLYLSLLKVSPTALVALIVGGFGALIAYRQWRTARNRLKPDLFDRRLPALTPVRLLLDGVPWS